jgi:hypothetical protein
MEAAAGSSGRDGVFAAAINANDRMVMASSTAAAQLTTTTATDPTTIGKRHHCCGCHCVILPPSHWRLRRQPLSTKTTIAVAANDRHFHQQWLPFPPSMTNNNHWLLAVVNVDCVAAAMVVVNGRDSGHHQRWRRWDWANGTNGNIINSGSVWWQQQ